MLIRLVVGLGGTAVVGFFAASRILWLYRLVMSGQKTGDERTTDVATRVWTQTRAVAGQSKRRKWSIPGLAPFFTMWAFLVLLTVYIQASALLFNDDFAIPLIGDCGALVYRQD